MRTRTHILTLLIAATMILSSAVTMASVNENTILVEEDITNPAPASVGEFDGAFSPPSPELNIVEDRLNRYNSYNKADVVWDNDLSYLGMGASHQCSAYDAKAADDFMFSEDTGVGGVQWIGGHWNGDPIPSEWGIEFFEDDGTGTAPGAMIGSPMIFDDSEITKVTISITPGGSSYFDYTVLLPDGVQCDAGERYWIAIYGASEYPPQTGFAYHDTPIIGAEASWMSIYFGTPDWTPQARDHAFKLYGVDTDVFVSAIIAPNDLSAFCPCTPVEVEVTNVGQAEQTFPVDVEIRRNLMCEDFEAPPPPPYVWPPVDPMFGPWTLVNGGEGPETYQHVGFPICGYGIAPGFPHGGISGDFAYANSDGAPGSEWMIEDLVTPALPLGTGAPYMVEFDYEIYGYSEDIIVYIAPTFGGPWIPAGPPIIASGLGFGHWMFDLMAAAPVHTWPAVYVSWTYDDHDSWGYDAAIDNIMIYDLGAPWMVFETFSSPSVSTFPPAGWSETSYGGGDWDQVTSETAYPNRAVPRDNYMAEFMSGLMIGDSLLETMAFDFTDACNPMVSFYMWHDTYGSDDYLEILVDDGSGWVGTGDTFSRLCCPDCPDGWIEHIIDLSAYAGVNGVTIGFYGVGDANPGAYNLQIDDVCVYDQEYYEEMDVTVPGASTISVEFPEWCICNWNDPAWADTYEDVVVIASTHLDIDEVPSNDAMVEDITVYIPFEHDIAAISIDEPVDTVPVQTFEMCGTIKNVGQYEECCFSVYMTVEEVVFGAPVTLFAEDFESYGAYMIPTGWVEETPTGNWGTYYDYEFGSMTNLRFYWIPYVVGTYRIITPAIDTTAMPEVTIEFDHVLSHFSGPYTLSVETSTTGLPGSFTPIADLTWDNPTGWGATSESATTGQDCGGMLYLAFTFSGDPYNLNNWNIDNIIVTGRTMSFLPPEWEDDFCIDDIEVCEEVQICFNDWTPATPWPDCGSKTYRICMETAMCDPPDENPANDIVCDFLTVEFWRDVSVDITSPSKRADTFYAVDAGLDNFVSFDPLIPGTYTVISSSGFTAFPQGACFDDSGVMWTCDTNGLIYTRDEGTGTMTLIGASGAAGGLVALAYDDSTGTLYGASTTALHTINMGTGVATLVGAYGGAVISLMISVDCDLAGTMYGLELGFSGAGALHSIDTSTGIATKIANTGLSLNFGQDISYDKDNNILYGALFNYDTFQGEFYTIDTTTAVPTLIGVLDGGAQTTCLAIPYTGSGTPPPPPVDIWVTCGEQDFCATFENLGTFDEPGCIIDWAIYEWDGGPVYLDGGSETIDLGVGEVVEDYCFGSYDFDEDGVYILEVEIIAPVMDCYLDNNEDDLVIGVDCCPPETTFVLDPEQPNGENNWYTSSVTVTIDAVDCCDPPYIGSGVDEIRYKINGVAGSISGDHGTISVSDNGVHLIEIWAIDNAGNEEADHHTFEIAIDAGDPSVGLIYEAYEEDDGWHVDFTASVSDDTSGIEKVEFYIGSSLEGTLTEAPFVWSIAWEDGYESEDFKATAYDNAGNSASDTVDGSIIEAIPHSFQAQATTLPVWLVQQQTRL